MCIIQCSLLEKNLKKINGKIITKLKCVELLDN